MTRAEIIAWTDEATRRVAQDKVGAPLTERQRRRFAEMKRKAAPKRSIWKRWLSWHRTAEETHCDHRDREWA